MVVPVPSAGQAGMGAQGMHLEVVEQPAMEAIPLPTTGQTGLLTALKVPTMVGVTWLVKTPLALSEVAVTVIGRP